MKKRIGRRFVSLLLTVVTVLTMLPAMTLPALAATKDTLSGLDDKTIGLSFDGDADNAWSAIDKQIVGHAQSTSEWWQFGSQTNYSSTLTITNKKDTKATLSFDYTVALNGGIIKVNGDAVTAGGKVSKELGRNGTVTVSIQSGSTKAETKITMTNVTLVSADTTATVTFQPAENGSYTVDGKTITEVYTHTQSSMTAYQVVATPVDGYRFKGWYDVNTGTCINTNATTALSFDSDCTITARFRSKDLALFETGGQLFDDLNDAVAYAQANNLDKITLASDGKITGTYTIPSGVTLLIPFDETGTLYANEPGYVGKAEAQKAHRILTMAPNSSITVDGAISVGGKHYAGSTGSCCKATGPYGQIIMQEGSRITLNNHANLYAWGYITGDGQITANSGATVYEYFQVADWRGGAAVSKLIREKKVFPFSQYYVQNIEAALTIQAGAQEHAYFSVDAALVGTRSVTIDFIGSSNSLFRLGSRATLTKKYDPKTDRITYTTTGSASLDSLALSVAGYNINSINFVLPVNNNMTLKILSGSVAVNCDAALLPGAQIAIAQGADLSVSTNKSLYVYDKEQWKGPYVYGSKESGFVPIPYSPSKKGNRTLTDAKIDVNGTLTAVGSIYTTNSGADICSSEGSGRFVQQNAPGSSTLTHQVSKQENPSPGIAHVYYDDIPITPAKLHNANNTYTETANASAGQTIPYCTCPTCGGKWLKDFAAIIDSTGKQTPYPSLKAAVDKYSPDNSTAPKNYIKLLHNTTEKPISVSNKSLRLDLNGRTVTGDISVTNGHKLYGMDSSASADYTTAPTGKIVGKVTGTVAPTYQTPPVTTPDGDTYDRYVAIQGKEADNTTANLTFHHFNISVTGYHFELATGDTPQCALFFIGKFRGDDAAKKYLTKLGFTLKYIADESQDFSYPMPGSLNNEVGLDEEGAYLFEAYLMRSFDKNDATAYQTKISATAQAIFGTNVGTQNSETKEWSFEDAWKNPGDLTSEQKAILDKFLKELDITNP